MATVDPIATMQKPSYIPPHLRQPKAPSNHDSDSMNDHIKSNQVPPHLRLAHPLKKINNSQRSQTEVITPQRAKSDSKGLKGPISASTKAEKVPVKQTSPQIGTPKKAFKVDSTQKSSKRLHYLGASFKGGQETSSTDTNDCQKTYSNDPAALKKETKEEAVSHRSSCSTWPNPSEFGRLSIKSNEDGLVSGKRRWSSQDIEIYRVPTAVIRSWQNSVSHLPEDSIDTSSKSFQSGSIMYGTLCEQPSPFTYAECLLLEKPEPPRAGETCEDAVSWVMEEACNIRERLKKDYIHDLRGKTATSYQKWHHVDEEYQNDHSPKIGMYIRPANRNDIREMRKIQEYWAANPATLCNDELPELSYVEEANLPWIVAVLGNPESPGRVVGYFFAESFGGDLTDVYRYTVEVQLFVSPRYVRLGIGRCLLDKGLAILDTHYMRKGGYDFCASDTSYEDGGRRDIRTIIFPVPCPEDDKSHLTWLESYLERRGFEKSVALKKAIYKSDTWVDLVYFQRATETSIQLPPKILKA